MNDKLNVFDIKLTTISPVSIGNNQGDTLSPYTDFVVRGDTLHLLDHKKINKALEKEPQLIDEYVNGIREKIDNNRSRFDLLSFVQKRLKLNLEDITKQKIPAYGLEGNKIEVKPILKNAGKPYISGSTLKGAVKAAILYDWLLESTEGKKKIEEFCNNVLYINNLTQIDLKKELDNIINLIFGRVESKEPNNFYYIRITDTGCIDSHNVEIHNTMRIHLLNGQWGIPQCKETIKANEVVGFRLSIEPKINHSYLNYLNNSTPNKLFKIINRFSQDNIDLDWDIFDNYGEAIFESRETVYNQIYTFFENISNLIEKAKEGREAYLRIGSGKTFMYNSVGLAIYKTDKNAFDKFIQLLRFKRAKQSIFPVTRLLSLKDSQQLGWIKIEHNATAQKREQRTELPEATYFDSEKKIALPYCITNIEISNFRGIQQQKLSNIEADAQWIYLTGENGFGKTSVLQALAIGLNGIKDGKTILTDENLEVKLVYRNNDLFQMQTVNQHYINQIPFKNFVSYGPARLDVQSIEMQNTSSEKNSNVYSLFNSISQLLNIEYEMLLWKHEENPNLEMAKNIFYKIIPTIAQIEVNTAKRSVEYYEEDQDGMLCDKPLCFKELASGYKSLIAMIGDMMIRFSRVQPDVKKIQDYAGIVIIDEFDLHLHPKWQRRLPRILSEIFPKIQFWVSTHSIVPLMTAPKNSVFLTVKRSAEKGIEIERVHLDIKNLLPNTLLSSPLFGLYDYIHPEADNFRTETYFADILKNEELKKQAEEILSELKLPANFIDNLAK